MYAKKLPPSKEAFFLIDKLTGYENQFSYRITLSEKAS